MDKIGSILFNTPMVQAIQADIKTATRRVIMPPKWSSGTYDDFNIEDDGALSTICNNTGCYAIIRPKYNPGDIFWVRETWCNINKLEYPPEYYYLADCLLPWVEDYDQTEWKWRPSIHMPKEAARIFLKVTAVYPQQIQDMTREGVIKEGIFEVIPSQWWFEDPKNTRSPNQSLPFVPKQAFRFLWDRINGKRDGGKYNWILNPWVWVIEFERCVTPVDFMNSGKGVINNDR